MLAGGSGTRFGATPKGLATVAGERVIDRVATALRAASDELLLVANAPEAEGWLPGVPRIADVRRGAGPLSGIHAALNHARGAVLVVAWDMPFVEPGLLGELRRRGREGLLAVVPESDGGQLEPTCAWYAAACRGPIEWWLDGGRSGAAAFLAQSEDVHRMPVDVVARFGDPARLFFSINTPLELRQAEELAASSP